MVAPTTGPLDFPLFKLVNDARSTYGLRHQDFARYQSHCTAKVHHLRKSVGLTQVAGKTKKYTKKDVTELNVTTDKHLQILLFDTERAWAHSQLIKSTLSLPTTPVAAKHHLIKRLSRAVLHADHLLSLVNALSSSSRVSTSQKGQTTAYYLLMKGSLAFEKAQHQAGLNSLAVAHDLLTTLSRGAETANLEALTNEVIDEVEPMLRFCAYSLQLDVSKGVGELVEEVMKKEESGKLVEGYGELAKELEKEGKSEKRESVELVWRGREIPVRSAELVGVVLKVQQAIKSLEADKDVGASGSTSTEKKGKGGRKDLMGARRMGTYDKALTTLGEAEDVARQLVEDNKIALSKAHSARFEASSAPLQLAHSYIIYQLLSVRTKRDLLLISSTSSKLSIRELKIREKEREYVLKTGARDEDKAEKKVRKHRARVYPSLVKIYDGIVLSLEQMRELEVVEQDGDLAAKVEARIAFVRASRTIYLARTYALVEQFPSSLSLNARGKLYARESRSMASSLDDEDEDNAEPDFIGDLISLTSTEFDALDAQLEADYIKTSKEWYAATGGNVGEDVEPEDLPIADLSLVGGAKEKKSKKPDFYDIAFNYVAAFDLEGIAKKAGLRGEVEEEVEVQKGGAKVESEEEEDDERMAEEQQTTSEPAKKSGWGFGLFGRK